MSDILHVAGVSFEGRQEKLAFLKQVGLWDVLLEPEPTNPHDPNAVRVLAVPGDKTQALHVGYLSREDARRLGPAIRDGRVDVIRAWVVGNSTLGMRLEIVVTDKAPARPVQPELPVVEAPQPEPAPETKKPQEHEGKEEAPTMQEVWVAVAFRLAKTGERWVIVGKSQKAWAIRGDSPVPKQIADISGAIAAISEALRRELPEVPRIGDGRQMYLEALGRISGTAA